MHHRIAIAALALLAASAQAELVAFQAHGALLPLSPQSDGGNSYIELFGPPNYSRYLLPAAATGEAFEALAARSAALSSAALSSWVNAQATLVYDTGQAALSSPSTTTKRFPAQSFSLQLSDTLGQAGVLNAATSTIRVSERTRSRSFSVDNDSVSFPPTAMVGSGWLGYLDPDPVQLSVDLRALIASDTCNCSTPFDLTGVPALPAHLVGPASYRAVAMNLFYSGQRPNGPADTPVLPNPFDSARYGGGGLISVYFDGEFSIDLHPGDYASQADYLSAKAWVDANIMRISYEQGVDWQVGQTLAVPVPEPATWALWAAGVLLWAGWRRQIRHT